MSRSGLHRRLKAATGMSAMAYIRYLRLRQAAQLLVEQPERSVFCIAIEVGFNDHSYFTKRFREAYGVCPISFRSAQQNLGHTS
jgi:AraC-like DNA-binding protein